MIHSETVQFLLELQFAFRLKEPVQKAGAAPWALGYKSLAALET